MTHSTAKKRQGPYPMGLTESHLESMVEGWMRALEPRIDQAVRRSLRQHGLI